MSETRKKATVIMHRPSLRLTQLINRSGGLARDVAISQAQGLVDERRSPSLEAVDALIAELEDLCDAGRATRTIVLTDVLRRADAIINLAETFAIDGLVSAAKNLCDMCNAFLERGIDEFEPVWVHVRALRLLFPADGDVPAAVQEAVLSELSKVSEHFDVSAQVEPDDWAAEPSA